MYSPQKVYAATMTSGGDTCIVHLQNAFTQIYLACPTMSTAADRNVYGSWDGTTYYQAAYPLASGLTSPASMIIGSGVTGKVIALGFQAPYIKIQATAVVSGGGTYRFICT